VQAAWHSETLTWPARQAVRLLLLTGARVNEIVQAAWSEFDLAGEVWTLPEERSKNHRTLLTPITPLVAELLEELRDIFLDNGWLFPARNSATARQPWGATALSHAVRKAGYDWRPQDLRRTMKTLAGEAGLSKEIRDRIQNHAAQDVSSRHYDKFDYQREKKIALQQWESYLFAQLIQGGNILPFKKQA